MKVIIHEDGKMRRGSCATLVRRGNKRVLIKFSTWDYDLEKEVELTEWFKVFRPYSRRYLNKYNNKSNKVTYCHEATNMFYSDNYQTAEHRAYIERLFSEDYFKKLYF